MSGSSFIPLQIFVLVWGVVPLPGRVVGEMVLDGPVEVCDTPEAEVVDPVQHEELAGDDLGNDAPEVEMVDAVQHKELVRDDKGNDPEVIWDTPKAEVVDEVQMVDGRPGYIELITVHVGAKGAEFG